MQHSVDYFRMYGSLSPSERKQVLRTLKYWGGWTKTSVYRKLQCPNLSPIEEVLVEGVFRSVLHRRSSSCQLEISFCWSYKDECIQIS